MNLAEDIKPISTLKSKTAESIKHVVESSRPMIITQNGEAKAVLQDIKSYENMKNSLAIMKLLSKAEGDVKNNRLVPQGELFAKLQKDLK